jgi:hypothetical protein
MLVARHVATLKDMRNAYKILVGESAGDRPLRRHSHEYVSNIKMGIETNSIENFRTVFIWLRAGTSYGLHFEHDNETSGSVKSWSLLRVPAVERQFLKTVLIPWG